MIHSSDAGGRLTKGYSAVCSGDQNHFVIELTISQRVPICVSYNSNSDAVEVADAESLEPWQVDEAMIAIRDAIDYFTALNHAKTTL